MEPTQYRRIVMVPLAGLSRRAFVVVSALTAIAPTATAARRRKPAPEAFLAIAVQGVTTLPGVSECSYQAQLQHPASGFTKDMSGTVTGVLVTTSQDETRSRSSQGPALWHATISRARGMMCPRTASPSPCSSDATA